MLMMSAPSANSFKIAGSLIMYLIVINTINPMITKPIIFFSDDFCCSIKLNHVFRIHPLIVILFFNIA